MGEGGARCGRSLVPLGEQMSETLQRVFERWASFESGDQFERERGSLQHVSRNLQQQLQTLESVGNREPISDQALADLYTMLGSARGLIEAMANAQAVFSQINWHQWATPRF